MAGPATAAGLERVLCFRESDGAQLWTYEYDCPYSSVALYAIGPRCTPTVDGDMVFTLGAEGHLVCLQVEDGTAVIRDGYVYGCGNGGRYICADLQTGNRVWSSFLPSTGTRPASWANVFTVAHKDRFFLANDLGDLIIAKLSPQGYEEVSRAHLIDPTHAVSNRTLVWSHPALANRSVYLRNDQELRCYSLAQMASSDPESNPGH